MLKTGKVDLKHKDGVRNYLAIARACHYVEQHTTLQEGEHFT